MSKLSFRARALDPSKPMPIYMAEELPDLPDYSVINRAVPQMPSGMKKAEESEHHLQRAISAGLIIPTPEVSDISDKNVHDKLYPANYKQPRQLIHMQPFTMEQDIPDYDMDSEDERWLATQPDAEDITPFRFEEMMDQLEKNSGHTISQGPQAVMKEENDLTLAVFDYWLNKRLKLKHPLILAVKTEHRSVTGVNNPYIVFRRLTEKMQTRKNRKNDEASYEKMLKLRRDLSRAVNLLEFIKKREKMKRELVQLTVEVFEKRYAAKDFSGAIAAEFAAQKAPRPAFTPIFQNNYANHSWNNKAIIKEESIQRNQKRTYKKRKHKPLSHNRVAVHEPVVGNASSDEEPAPAPSPEPEEPEDEGMFAFRRNKNCSYHMPLRTEGDWPWCAPPEGLPAAAADKRYRYTLTSLAHPRQCIGFARRRLGRGGRVIIDRLGRDVNDFWRKMDYTVYESTPEEAATPAAVEPSRTASLSTATTTTTIAEDDIHNSIASVDNRNRTDFKTEPEPASAGRTCGSGGASATAWSSAPGGDSLPLVPLVKEEPIEDSQPVQPQALTAHDKLPTQEEQEEMLEMLQSVRREWLHFRPKTPPSDYVPPCHLLPADDPFMPSANMPFALELKAFDDSDLFTESTFVSAPFLLDYDIAAVEAVPITDTRQATSPNNRLNDTLNTLASTPTTTRLEDSQTDAAGEEEDVVVADEVVGCSRFSVSDNATQRASKRHEKQCSSSSSSSSTFTSPKLNSHVQQARDGDRWRQLTTTTTTTSVAACASTPPAAPSTPTAAATNYVLDASLANPPNGLLTPYTIEGGVRSRMSKYDAYNHPYARAAPSSVPPQVAAGGGVAATAATIANHHTYRGLQHAGAHTTVTLNSHSANILEIPLSSDAVADAVTSAAAASGKGARDARATSPSSKAKAIVRKNLVMEVT